MIVTWLQFTVDGAPYHFRSFFPVQPEKTGNVEESIASAVSLTIDGIAPRVNAVTTNSPLAPSGTDTKGSGTDDPHQEVILRPVEPDAGQALAPATRPINRSVAGGVGGSCGSRPPKVTSGAASHPVATRALVQ